MTESKNERHGTHTAEPILISIHPRFYQLPGMAILVGTAIGLMRGARGAGLQFQAENAHRPPTTLRGWYLYRKTKNYKVILGGLKEGGKLGSKLGLTGVVWVGAEEALTRAGWDDIREVGAGLFIAGMFSAAYQLPWGRNLPLGLMVGGTMRGFRWLQTKLRAKGVEGEMDKTQE